MDWLTVSLVGNVIQFVINLALFFKSFLNKLIETWWLDRRQEARHRRGLLKTLNAHLEQLPRVYLNFLAFASLAQYDRTDEGRAQAVELRDRNAASVETILEFMRNNRFDFPHTVRQQLERLERAMVLTVDEITVLDVRVIMQATERIQQPLLDLQAVVRAEM